MAPLVTLVLHKFSRGGSDRVAAYLAKGFADAGYRVELVVFAKGGEVEKVLLDILGPVQVHFLRNAGRSRPLDLLLGLPAIVRHLRRVRPDIVLSTANNTALISAIACRMARVKEARLVLKTTNPIVSSRHRGLVRRLRLWSYRRVFGRSRAVWTLSEDESAEMRSEFPKFADLFKAVAQPYVTPAMEQSAKSLATISQPLILSVARLTSQKRLDRLIRAFALVKAKGARLMILGEGEDRETLSRLAQQLGIGDRIQMPGYLPDVSHALRDADLFVLTSEYEGLPAAVIEAMAANCPVLSTDCFPSARSLIGTSEGCEIIDDVEPAAIAEQIDRALRSGRPTSLSNIANSYSIERGVESHLRALSGVLETSALQSTE